MFASPVRLEFTGSTSGVAGKFVDESSSTSSVLGVLHQLSPWSLKATCRNHPNCVLWLSYKDEALQAQVLQDLCTWIREGLPEGTTPGEQKHWQAARRYKR